MPLQGSLSIERMCERRELVGQVFIDPFTNSNQWRKSWKCVQRFSTSPSNTGDATGIAAFVPSYDGEACG